MKKTNIVLLGFMGSGKSLTANKLGKICRKKVVSTDIRIEQKEKRAIAEIFETSGESYFRAVEKKVVQEIAQERGVIVDCGGGVVLDPVNMDLLSQSGILIYLSASAEAIFKNIKNTRHRPLLNVADPLGKIKELLAVRGPLYARADYTIETDHKTLDEVCEEIKDIVKGKI